MKRICKRITLCLTALALLLCGVGCAKQAPGITDEEAEKILTELLPKSQEMMKIFYGDGLGVDEYEEDDLQVNVQYEPVVAGQGYESVADLKKAMDGVFSAGYKVELYTLMFDGYSEAEESEGDGEVSSLDSTIYPRYKDVDGKLCINVRYRMLNVRTIPSAVGATVIDGDADRVTVQISYTTEDGKSGKMNVTLAKEGDTWLIDGPTY